MGAITWRTLGNLYPSLSVDKPFSYRYYCPTMASERIQRRIDRLLDQAEEAMDRSDWESVRDHAKVALGLDPENTDALAFLASVEQVLEAGSTVPSSPSTAVQPTEPAPSSLQPTSFANGPLPGPTVPGRGRHTLRFGNLASCVRGDRTWPIGKDSN